MCAAMKWSHLPEPGGMYQQHPLLLDAWQVIFAEQARHEKAVMAKQESKSKKKK